MKLFPLVIAVHVSLALWMGLVLTAYIWMGR